MVPGLPDIDLSIQQCAQHDPPEFPVRVVRVCRQALALQRSDRAAS